eukprot:3493738-Amphidinium_carterae.1
MGLDIRNPSLFCLASAKSLLAEGQTTWVILTQYASKPRETFLRVATGCPSTTFSTTFNATDQTPMGLKMPAHRFRVPQHASVRNHE